MTCVLLQLGGMHYACSFNQTSSDPLYWGCYLVCDLGFLPDVASDSWRPHFLQCTHVNSHRLQSMCTQTLKSMQENTHTIICLPYDHHQHQMLYCASTFSYREFIIIPAYCTISSMLTGRSEFELHNSYELRLHGLTPRHLVRQCWVRVAETTYRDTGLLQLPSTMV